MFLMKSLNFFEIKFIIEISSEFKLFKKFKKFLAEFEMFLILFEISLLF
jgi:hypothetical protein